MPIFAETTGHLVTRQICKKRAKTWCKSAIQVKWRSLSSIHDCQTDVLASKVSEQTEIKAVLSGLVC